MTARASIVCLEGPSAVGKSTIARLLAERHGYLIIPEVNELFRNGQNEERDWYLKHQVDRYNQAMTKALAGHRVILDGDPFQPLWYNWIYPHHEPLERVIAFYREAIDQGLIAFPDLYVVLQAPTEELVSRKTGDTTRRRRNFDRHLQMIAPQRRFFKQLGVQGIAKVELLENADIEEVASRIARRALHALPTSQNDRILSTASDWLANNEPFPK